MSLFLNISFLLLILAEVIFGQQKTDAIVNKKVDRIIDISTQLVTITCRINFENNRKSAATNYFIKFEDDHANNLASLTASIGTSNSEKAKNQLQISKKKENNIDGWSVDLGEYTVQPGETSPTLEIEAVFTGLITPYPTEILQSEKQLVLYNGNHYFYSPYLTKSQNTKIKLPSGGSIESFSKLKPTSQSDNSISYGPYENIPENSLNKLQVHYENNSPFLVVKKLERDIQISQWAGILSIEEVVDLKHAGANLKGAFSRYEFQREPTNGISAVKSFKTKLPILARDIYYRDEIGNISTSNVRRASGNVVAELRPRFPLFGGWKTHYTLGYNMPTQKYLFNDGNQFVLRIPFVNHLFDSFVIEEAFLRIALPEGATDIKVRLPFTIERQKDEIRKTYLDTFGRTVIVLRKTNVIEKHSQDIEVQYSYNRIYMLQQPFLLILAFFSIAFIVMVTVRLDFTITVAKKKPSENAKETQVGETASKVQKKKH